jgi:hypothetical protein
VHLADVLLDDVKVVEQPFACRAYIPIIRRVRGETLARASEYASRFVQPGEKWRAKSPLLRRNHHLFARQVECALAKAISAERIAAKGPCSKERLFVRNTGSNAAHEPR